MYHDVFCLWPVASAWQDLQERGRVKGIDDLFGRQALCTRTDASVSNCNCTQVAMLGILRWILGLECCRDSFIRDPFALVRTWWETAKVVTPVV